MWIAYSRYIPSKSRIVQIVVAKPACIAGVQRIAEFTLAEVMPRNPKAHPLLCDLPACGCARSFCGRSGAGAS